MAGRLLPRMFDMVIDGNGAPVAGALMYTYVNTTTTPKTTYTTSALSVAHANPIVADSAGRFPDIWADDDQTFRVKMTTPGAVLIYQSDNIITLGQNPDGTITRDFGADGRFKIYASGGVANYEGGDPSPDDVGGKVRIGGWSDTTATTIELDGAATTVDGTLAVAGAASFAGGVTLSDGSQLTNSSGLILQSGRYYQADPIIRTNGASDTLVLTVDQIYWLRFSRGITADALVFNINTALAGNARIGLYTSNGVTGLPDTLIEQSAAISIGSTGSKVAVLAASHVVTTGVWLAFVASSAATIVSADSAQATTRLDGRTFGQVTQGTNVYGKYSAFPFAALPNAAPAITGDLTANIPYLSLRSA